MIISHVKIILFQQSAIIAFGYFRLLEKTRIIVYLYNKQKKYTGAWKYHIYFSC